MDVSSLINGYVYLKFLDEEIYWDYVLYDDLYCGAIWFNDGTRILYKKRMRKLEWR